MMMIEDDAAADDDEEERNIGGVGKQLQLQGDSGSPLVLPINGRFQVKFCNVKKAASLTLSLSKTSTKCFLHQVIGLVSWGIGCAR